MSGRRTRSRRSYPLNHAQQPAEVLEQRSLLSGSGASAVFVEATGELSLELGSSESVQVSAVAGSVLVSVSIDGSVYVPFTGIGTLPAASIVSLNVFGGDDANTIDLSNVTLVTFPNLTSIQAFGGDGNDVLIGSPNLANQLFGDDGRDSLTGGLADDTLNGGDGNDTIISNEGNDSIAAGDGADSVVAGDGNDVISAGNGNDTVLAGNGDDSVAGENGQDSLLGEAGNDTINGDGGFDTLIGGDGNDLMLGGDLNDSLVGDAGDDTLFGNSGDDTLVGVTGFDIADGGAGNDLIRSALVIAGDDAVPAAAQPAPIILSPSPLPDAVDSTLGIDTNALTATIGSGTGDGGLAVQVTSTGAFGIGSFPTTMSAGAPYDPIGAVAVRDTTFDSEVYFRASTTTGARSTIESLATNPTSIRGTASEANSAFDIGALHFVLTQVAERGSDLVNGQAIGSLLTQTYRITNTGATTADFELARYFDGRLQFDGSQIDGGGRFVSTAGDEFLFETDAGGLSSASNFVAITSKGGTIPALNRFQIDQSPVLQTNLQAGTALNGQVFNDNNTDQSIDVDYDVTLGLRNTFSLAADASATYTTHTLFGTGTPNQVQLNREPVAVPDTSRVLEGRDVAIDVVANDFDVDGSLNYLSIKIAQLPINGTATSLGDGRIDYTPNAGFSGTDTFAYTIADNLGARSAPAVVTVTVNALDVIGDQLNGGIGNDTILGGDGNDTILGGGGHDSLNGGAGDDRIQGQGGNDTITGGGGFDKLDGGDGNDVIRSTTGSLVINDVTVVEGDTSNVAAVFTVTLTVPSDSIVTVDFATSGGTATSGIDFVPTSGTLTFLPGVTTQTITVQTIGDTVPELDETYLVNLTNPTNATLTDARGQGTIGDTDGTTFGTPIVNVSGQGFQPLAPPDTDGEVGPNNYVQVINGATGALVQVDNKNGVLLRSFTMASLGRGNAPAAATTDGDGMVVYDQLADRWVLMEFSVGVGANPVFGLWVHVSQTPDPTNGLWNTYFFRTNGFPDYPKISVWPDAYYISTNESGATGPTPAVYALDRTNMLTGAAARPIQRFTGAALPNVGFQDFSPADLDGVAVPPTGSNAYFMRHNDDELTTPAAANASADSLQLWQFHVDFTTPANSGFSQLATISVSEFDSDIVRSAAFQGFGAIAQPGTATRLDPVPEIIMSRTHYRNFGTYEALVGTFTTETPGNMQHTGVRWFEMRRVAGGAWSLFQEGLVNPDNVTSRFMPSIDINGVGDIAIGYSVSDGVSTFPGMRYIGRRANDPLGTMPQGEFTIINGTGSQLQPDRWGDYSAMTVDPTDDRTFWYTSEYILAGGNWATQIASMAFSASSGIAPGSTPSPTAPDAGDSILGGAGNDTVLGANGNDTINGNAGNDVLGGGGGNDLIFGGADADTLSGGDGDDTLDGQGGNDLLFGDAGDDTFVLGNGSGGDDVVEGGGGFNQVQVNGTGSADNITIGANNRRITASRGLATITADNNMSVQRLVVNAGLGEDTVTVNDLTTLDCAVLIIVNGDEGNDRLTAQGSHLGLARLMMNGGAGNDTLIGSLDSDSLNGNEGNDAINGQSGNDSITGSAGDDVLAGGLGDDTLDGGDGADFMSGNAGNDRMRGGNDNDTLRGFDGDDTLDGQAGEDNLNGMDGNDVIRGGVGRDQIVGGAGNDSLDGGRNDDTINGNTGNDSIVGDHGDDLISAGDGDNTVFGGDGNDTILTEGGNDVVVGGDGNDVINTDGGNDLILGGDGNDLIQGGSGNDTVLGGDGNDTINGQGGADVIAGQQGIDVIADPFADINEMFSLTNLNSALIQLLSGPAPFPT